jgi:anti-sigma-K factor RskA
MSSNRNEQLEELFPFYALGVLSVEEQEAIEAYVAQNKSAQMRLSEEMETLDILAASVTPVMPPVELKNSLMARVREEKAARVAPRLQGQSSVQVTETTSVSWWQRFLMPAFALATLVALLAIGWNISLQRQVETIMADNVALEQALNEQQDLTNVLTAANRKIVSISLINTAAAPSGQFIFDESKEEGVLLVSGLEPLTDDQTYQFWVADTTQTVSGGVFEINEFGQGLLALDGTAFPLETLDHVGISIEPAGGSDAPTQVVLLGNVQN